MSSLQQEKTRSQRAAWTVPVILISGIICALSFHWPIFFGILIGFVWSLVYANSRFPWREVWQATFRGIRNMWQICVAMILIGALLALWMQLGTIPVLIHISSITFSGQHIVWMSFLAASVLSMVIGSSIATWGILGPPLMAIVTPHFAPMVAGAIVSGGMVGDRASPMSTSILVMSKATNVPYRTCFRQLNRSMLVPLAMTLVAFMLFGLGADTTAPAVSRNFLTTRDFVLIGPPLAVILLALLRVQLVWNLTVSLFLSGAMTIFLARVHLLQIWSGVAFHNGTRVLHIGGVESMVLLSLLILVAGAFQGVTELGGSIEFLTERVFDRFTEPWSLTLGSYGLSISFALVMGSQMLAVLMSGNTLLPRFTRRGLSGEQVLQVIGDAAELISAVIPWNMLGLQAAAILGLSTFRFAPFTWFVYAMIGFSIMTTWHRIRHLRGKSVLHVLP